MKTTLFLVILFLANVVQNITGFAGAMLSIPLAAQLFGLTTAKVAVITASQVGMMRVGFQSRRSVNKPVLGRVLLIMGVGMLAGMLLANKTDAGLMMMVYGIFIIAFALVHLVAKKIPPAPLAVQFICLFLAGVVHGALGAGGALLVVYATAALPEKNEFRATVTMSFVLLNLFLIAGFIAMGQYTPQALLLSALGIPPTLISAVVGGRIHKKINQQQFTRLVYILLLVVGITCLL